MFRILALLVIASFLISGCSGVDVYTFKKERVDQTIRGNEGYVQGAKIESVPEDLNRKRTLIGVDIEVPSTSSTSSETKKDESVKSTQRIVETKAGPVVEKETVEETEEDWIK